MWSDLEINLEAHDGLLGVLSGAYTNIYLSQKNLPERMKYFYFVISEVHGLRIEAHKTFDTFPKGAIRFFSIPAKKSIVR